ncbi:MAG: hypothetical protein ABIV51_03325, partial [Saprospiraceae bacterium]
MDNSQKLACQLIVYIYARIICANPYSSITVFKQIADCIAADGIVILQVGGEYFKIVTIISIQTTLG